MDIILPSPLLHKTFHGKNKFYLKFDVVKKKIFFYATSIFDKYFRLTFPNTFLNFYPNSPFRKVH